MKNEILSILPGDHPWAEYLRIYDSLPSTNSELKRLAEAGAPEGTTVIAHTQTAGRGRMGKSFHSPKDGGLYISLLLRPNCAPAELMHLTCAVAVAACEAIEKACGEKPGIKWINDLVMCRKKLAGILTELSIYPETGLVDYAIIGIGINCRQETEEFPPELQSIATSLKSATGKDISPGILAGHLLCALSEMAVKLSTHKDSIMNCYRENCLTISSQVQLTIGEERFCGTAESITADGALIVKLPSGEKRTFSSGEASVRGLFGYT